MRSYKVQQKAAQVGFDWDKPEDVLIKIDEEVAELKEAYESSDHSRRHVFRRFYGQFLIQQ